MVVIHRVCGGGHGLRGCPSWWEGQPSSPIVIVWPLCHVVHLVATSLTAAWHLDVLHEEAVRGKGGGFWHAGWWFDLAMGGR
jgi:hypothetical protein